MMGRACRNGRPCARFDADANAPAGTAFAAFPPGRCKKGVGRIFREVKERITEEEKVKHD